MQISKKTIKIALCRPAYTKVYNFFSEKGVAKRDITVPYSLLSLAGHVGKIFGDTVRVKIFDGEVGVKSEQEILQEITDWEPDMAGFTVTTPEIDRIRELSSEIKECLPGCKIIFGGPHITGTHAGGEYPGIDYLVTGEGEAALEEIIYSEIKGRGDKSNTLILHGKDIDLSETGNPDYSLIDPADYHFIDPYRGFVRANTVFTVRGCPYRCRFCFANRNYRRRDLDTVMREISELYSGGVRQIVFNDETLTQEHGRFRDLSGRLIASGYDDLVCVGLTRADRITQEVAKRLAESNFTRMYVGVESGCDHILKLIEKGTSTDKIRRGVDLLRAEGIIVRGSFILGLPYDTHETIRQTIDFAKELDIQTAGFNIAMPYPGTRLYDMAMDRDGIEFTVDTEADDFYSQFKRWGNCITRTPEVCSEDLINYQKQAVDEFYCRDKIIDFFRDTFEHGNCEVFWHRMLNHVYRRVYGRDVEYWDQLKQAGRPEECVQGRAD